MSSAIWKEVVRSVNNQKGEILSRFFSQNQITEARLFQMESDQVISKCQRYMRNVDKTIWLLQRNPEMESHIFTEAAKVILSYRNRMNPNFDHYQGLIYFAYHREEDVIMPIYIGLCHRLGRHNNLNENLTNLNGRQYFARWGDDIARHIGGLSNAIFHNGFPLEPKYQRFADTIIQTEGDQIVEKQPLYFSIKAIPKDFKYDNTLMTLDELEMKLIKRFTPLVNTIFS